MKVKGNYLRAFCYGKARMSNVKDSMITALSKTTEDVPKFIAISFLNVKFYLSMQ
jgi:hypothetical protein